MTDVLDQGQFHGRDQSRGQASRKAQLSDQDASLMVRFDTKHAQFIGGSQQLLGAKRIADRRLRHRARRQQAEVEDNSVCIKRDTRALAFKM